MREILFRGKRIDHYVNDKSIDYAEKGAREWVYGDIIHRRYYNNKDVVVIRTEDSGFDNYSDYEVDPSTVGEYTGLTDKNGKKIFEGDIVSRVSYIGMGYREMRGEVVYRAPEFLVDCKHHRVMIFSQYAPENRDLEVIGNIYDNSELLEVRE